MDKLNEIKEKLNEIYKEYKANKSQLNSDKTKTAAKLIVEMTFSNNVNPSVVAFELSRFSADVVRVYFESLTKSAVISIEVLDEVLKEFIATDKDKNKSQHYVQKFIFAVTSIVKNYKNRASESKQLPYLVTFIARFAVKSDKNKNKFQSLINNTDGEIFMLDYSGINKNSLVNIWNAANNIYPDLSKAKYESFITEWGKKYDFIQENYEKSVKNQNTASNSAVNNKVNDITIDIQNKAEDNTTDSEKEIKNPTPDKNLSDVTIAKKLYNSLKKDIDNEQNTIITALTDMIMPINKAFETIQGEISKSREIGIENLSLKAKITDLENQLSEQKAVSQKINQSLIAVKAENDELKKKVDSLEVQNSELDRKLDDAYKINSRESSLEAERIRSELKKSFTFLYEDWLEYEYSDVSEDNYESLQAIIKKIFRSLERNGIDFKGNN